ncbi:MAG TPA: hypothetical protein VGH28_02525 [Polyangiaceae bacterium]|jgi:hypothetical protein
MPNETPTLSYRASVARVLIVHESPRPCFALADALRNRYVVRTVHTLAEVGAQIGLVDRLACVVCINGARLRGRDVRDEVVRWGVSQERIVFVTLAELGALEGVLATIEKVVEAFDTRARLSSWPPPGARPSHPVSR